MNIFSKIDIKNLNFKMANNYAEFGFVWVSMNYFNSGDFIGLVQLNGDLDVVGYAIIWGKDNIAEYIDSTYDDYKTATKEYIEIIKRYF